MATIRLANGFYRTPQFEESKAMYEWALTLTDDPMRIAVISARIRKIEEEAKLQQS